MDAKHWVVCLLLPALIGWAGAETFFGQVAVEALGQHRLEVTGEVAESVTIDLADLPRRLAVVREARPGGGEDDFLGAYRYEGPSLQDVLLRVKPLKRNREVFRPTTDLLVAVENAVGQRAVFSWGEVFYTADPSRILIATRAQAIEAAKTGEHGRVPPLPRLVSAADRLNVRAVSAPTRLVVFTPDKDYPRAPKSRELFQPTLQLYGLGGQVVPLPGEGDVPSPRRLETVRFGHGMGFHGYRGYTGVSLAELLAPHLPTDPRSLAQAYLVVAGADGYRATFSWAEVINRQDVSEPLLVTLSQEEEGGRFNVYATPDLYADRSVKWAARIDFVPPPPLEAPEP